MITLNLSTLFIFAFFGYLLFKKTGKIISIATRSILITVVLYLIVKSLGVWSFSSEKGVEIFLIVFGLGLILFTFKEAIKAGIKIVVGGVIIYLIATSLDLSFDYKPLLGLNEQVIQELPVTKNNLKTVKNAVNLDEIKTKLSVVVQKSLENVPTDSLEIFFKDISSDVFKKFTELHWDEIMQQINLKKIKEDDLKKILEELEKHPEIKNSISVNLRLKLMMLKDELNKLEVNPNPEE